jgi:hypothetical protein
MMNKPSPISEGVVEIRINSKPCKGINLTTRHTLARRVPLVATIHDVIKKSGWVLPRPSVIFHAYASADTPCVARTLSYCTPVKRGKVSSNLSTHEATQFGDSKCTICVSTFQLLVHSNPTDVGLNRHKQGLPLFCPHLVRAFSHLLVDHIASRYILKHYTRDHFMETTFDKHDKMFLSPDGDTTFQQIRYILLYLFKLQRSTIMSATAKTLIASAIIELDKISHDISLPVHHTPTGSAALTSSTPHLAERMTEQEECNVSVSTPPVSTTKGSYKKCARMTAGITQPHFQCDKRKKRRKCGRCGLYDTGHNVTTCEREQQQLKNGVIK